MYQISFLPFFPHDLNRGDLKIGRLHLFNFRAHKDKYIDNADIRAKIEQILQMYVTQVGSFGTTQQAEFVALNTPTIAVIDENYSFSMPTGDQRRDIENYAMALLLCSLVFNQQQSALASENLTVYHQNFNLAEDRLTYTSGSYVRTTNMAVSISDHKFVQPDFVPDPIFFRFDTEIADGLARMIDSHEEADESVLRALEFVRYAHLNADGYDYRFRVVQMATAFEILLDMPDQDKENEFSKRLEALLDVKSMQIYDDKYRVVQTGHSVITKPNSRGREKTSTMYGWWARDFYSLRSKIVHGDRVVDSDMENHRGAEHLRIALLMMRFCLHMLLEQKGYISFPRSEADEALDRQLGSRPDASSIRRHLRVSDLRKIEELIA